MAQRIRDIREDSDLTQQQTADYLGMSRTGYSKYETGENDIPTAIWIMLSKLYGTSVDYLMGRTDEHKPYPESAPRKGCEIIRNERKASGFNQTRTAALLNMSQTGYSKYETGENDVPSEIWSALADLYETSTDFLMGITAQREAYPKAKYR